jgi:hypothetical protein
MVSCSSGIVTLQFLPDSTLYLPLTPPNPREPFFLTRFYFIRKIQPAAERSVKPHGNQP